LSYFLLYDIQEFFQGNAVGGRHGSQCSNWHMKKPATRAGRDLSRRRLASYATVWLFAIRPSNLL
jgi:hypothetical protein